MPKAHYRYVPGGPYAEIQPHSIAKHDVLRAYLQAYFQTLAPSHQQEELRLTLVDGFAGGGRFEHSETKEVILGSPFVFLEAAKEAEFLINQGRNKPLKMSIDYFFVEKNKNGFLSLSESLVAHGFKGRLGSDIHLIKGAFEDHFRSISDFIAKKNPRKGRSIFLLDQYGYTDVPVQLVSSILGRFPSAEVILTFNVDSFVNFANDEPLSANLLTKVGIPEALRGRSIEDIKSNETDFRLYIQACLHRQLVKACGARYYTTFFIRSAKGHGVYWLVHLSQHHRARDVMTNVHWKHNNHFIHYGGPGLNMYNVLGYDPRFGGGPATQGAFRFDDVAQGKSIDTLIEQIPHHVFANDEGISFGELFATTCNESPADSQRYKEAIESLIRQKEIQVVSPQGSTRQKATTIRDGDRLIPSKQFKLIWD